MRNGAWHITFILLLTAMTGCKKPFEPAPVKAVTNFLVVDGNINIGIDIPTTIVLSRTKQLSDSILFDPETNASVDIEQEQGGIHSLSHLGNGIYRSLPLSLVPGKRYRLRIQAGNKTYSSAFETARVSPAIDSLTWQQDKDVTVSVHTHDPSNDTRYYRWDYTEVWNYSSSLVSAWGVSNGLVYPKDSTNQTDTCWRTAESTSILVGSSAALDQDVISYFPVAIIPQHTEKISKGYSILVRQYAITGDAFRYFQLIRKNTEQIGTLFDGQPSQMEGNIQCLENPAEPVIGFVTASTVSEKRLFIRNKELTDWEFFPPGTTCDLLVIGQHPTNYAIYTYPDPSYSVYYFVSGGIVIAKKTCLDCTEWGGTNVKPLFW